MTFTESEIEYLKMHWDNQSSAQIAKELGRKQGSISRKLKSLGLQTPMSILISEQDQLIKEGKRKCRVCCNVYANTNEFFYKRQLVCKECQRKRALDSYYKIHSELEPALAHKLQKARRANKNRFDSFISLEEALAIFKTQNGKCYYTGVELTPIPKQQHSLVMDRLNPKLGYIKSNVVFCCQVVNMMKQSMLPNEFAEWCQRVANTFKPSS